MALSIFGDKAKPPRLDDLAKVLGDTYKLWKNVKDYVIKCEPEAFEEWHFAGRSYGWSLRLNDPKRVIVYLIPCDNFFKVSFVFGEKATNDVMKSTIAQEIKNIINSARVYAEGRGFRLNVLNKDKIPDVKKLVKIKLKY